MSSITRRRRSQTLARHIPERKLGGGRKFYVARNDTHGDQVAVTYIGTRVVTATSLSCLCSPPPEVFSSATASIAAVT